MTKEGKFKDAIQDKIGATVDTTDLEKQLSVLNASLHQAETIKTRLEQQMDNLDVTDTHYDKKIVDLQRRLDAQYDRIDEVEETMTELKSQIYELKKNQIDADSIYGFLGAFNEVHSECRMQKRNSSCRHLLNALIYSRKDGKMEIGFRILSFSFRYRL